MKHLARVILVVLALVALSACDPRTPVRRFHPRTHHHAHRLECQRWTPTDNTACN